MPACRQAVEKLIGLALSSRQVGIAVNEFIRKSPRQKQMLNAWGFLINLPTR
jgi:hypothetical protein